ncbi:hypothetical protein QNH14_01660 [Apirhabdus apintestini]|nr:hypothetical protein QNH14_01660 [Enterobacteriaceae bacterium CA-0114]
MDSGPCRSTGGAPGMSKIAAFVFPLAHIVPTRPGVSALADALFIIAPETLRCAMCDPGALKAG